MSDMEAYLGNKVCRWLAGNAFPAAPADIYAALFDGDPRSGGTEVTTDVRVAGRVAFVPENIAAGEDNTLLNATDVDFGESANAVNVSYIAIYDAQVAGNRLFSKQIPGGPFAVGVGAVVKFPAGLAEFVIGSPENLS